MPASLLQTLSTGGVGEKIQLLAIDFTHAPVKRTTRVICCQEIVRRSSFTSVGSSGVGSSDVDNSDVGSDVGNSDVGSSSLTSVGSSDVGSDVGSSDVGSSDVGSGGSDVGGRRTEIAANHMLKLETQA